MNPILYCTALACSDDDWTTITIIGGVTVGAVLAIAAGMKIYDLISSKKQDEDLHDERDAR